MRIVVQTLLAYAVAHVMFNTGEHDTSVFLCHNHYSLMYAKLHSKQTCSSCGETGKRGKSFIEISCFSNDYLNQNNPRLIFYCCYHTVGISVMSSIHNFPKSLKW